MQPIEYLAQVAEIIGAVAVVISLIYLAVQVAGHTREMRSQAHFNALSLAQRPLELLIPDDDLSAIVQTGYAAPEMLSDADWHRFAMYQLMAFNAWEYLYYANSSRAIPASLWHGADAYYRDLIGSRSGLGRFWHETGHVFAQPFNTYVTEIFRSAGYAKEDRRTAASTTARGSGQRGDSTDSAKQPALAL